MTTPSHMRGGPLVAHATLGTGSVTSIAAVRWGASVRVWTLGRYGHGSRDRCSMRLDERGSISVWMAASSFVMIVLVGLAVDLGGKVHTQQQARNVAAQAARTGAQQVLSAPAVRGTATTADINAAKAAASSYLAQAGVTGTVSVRGGDTLVVTVSDTYSSKFLSIINLNSMPVTGEAAARMVRTEGGVEQ